MDGKLLGSRIKSRRIELELTQGDIANSIGVAISTIQRYETGSIQKIKLPVVEAIARCLQVNANWLIGKSEDKHPSYAKTESDSGNDSQCDILGSFLDFGYDYEADPEARLTPIPQDVYDEYFKRFHGDKCYIWAAYMASQNDVSDEQIFLNAVAIERIRYKAMEEAFEKIRNSPLPPPRITEDVVKFPIITSVAAHYDSLSFNESGVEGDSVEIPEKYLRGRPASDYCVMRVKGDSMYPDFRDGDLVLVLLQATLNRPRDIGVIAYGDDEMTIKRIDYVMGEDWLELIPINPIYPPKRIENAELERCRVIGIPKLVIREL